MKEVKPAGQLNKGKSLVETGLFLLILNVLVAVHGWQMIWNRFQVVGEAVLVDLAWVRQSGAPVFDPVNVDSYYIYLLHTLFLFFGNHVPVVPLANTVLQLLGVFLFYRGGRRYFNELTGIILALGAAAVSIGGFSVVEDDPMHLIWFVVAFLFWLLSFIKVAFRKMREEAGGEEEKPATITTDMVLEPDNVPKDAPEPVHEPKETPEPAPVTFIPNPLPVPKKHVKKEMDYAFEPAKEKMHYDLNNYRPEDDYDLKES